MPNALKKGLTAVGLLLLGAILGQFLLHALMADATSLSAWHRPGPGREMSAADANRIESLADYRELEDELFDATERWLGRQVDRFPLLSRFDRSSPTHPTTFDRDWNRTFELAVDRPRGGAVLLHGLSDSPFSLRSVGQQLHAAGYHVVGLRLPGHGTVPGALDEVAWEDWRAAVGLAVAEVAGRIGAERPLVLAGYSNGAALALDHAVAALDDADLRAPSAMIMLSPAIAVTRLAALARYQRLLGRFPGLESLRWSSVVAEYDPFKYNSFPMRAASEIYRLTSNLESRLARLEREGRTAELPPILISQSIVDATVPPLLSLPRIVDRLAGTGSELILFDVNRLSVSEAFLRPGVDALLSDETSRRTSAIRVTLVTNVEEGSRAVEARTREAGDPRWTAEPLALEWPPGVYSQSHVSVPFPPDDPAYGAVATGHEPFPLGLVDARGERGALIVSQDLFMRLRYNPFHSYQAERIARFLALE
jgi:alpha-beta hydrolase superfamily lysophospholipase